MPNNTRPRRGSYSQWVADAIKLVGDDQIRSVNLFESSVPEPRDLLRQTIADAIEPAFGEMVVSAFGGGNPYVIDYLAGRYNVEPAQILGTSGATSGLSLIYRTFTAPGDHVLVEAPGFDLFGDLAAERGVDWSTFQRRGDRFVIDLDEVAASVRANTKLIILSNIHNPSGMAIDHGDLVRLSTLVEERGILLVVDEVYGDYASKEMRPVPACALSKSVLSVSSLSKIFGLGSLRCGWVVGDPAIVAAIRDLSQRTEFGVSSLAHAMSAYVFERYDEFQAYADAIIGPSRTIFDRWFAAAATEGLIRGALPDAGCIAFPLLPGIEDTEGFSNWLIRKNGVLVAPGTAFGAPSHIRIGFAHAPEILEPGLAALSEGIRLFRTRDHGAPNAIEAAV